MIHLLYNGEIKMNKIFGDGGHSAGLRTLPLSGSLNRRICGSLSLTQISPCGETSHIPRTLYAIGFGTPETKRY